MSHSGTSSTAAAQGRKVALICVLLALLLAPVLRSAHRHTDAWAPRHRVTDEIKFLPTGDALKASSLGYELLVADILWTRTTLMFGKNYDRQDHGWYAWLFHMVDLATDLDPEFRAAYKYGGIMLRVEGVYVDQSSLIFQKGMAARPDEWYFPFGIAMNYFLNHGDREIAARYMLAAAETGGGPFYLTNLAASMQSDAGELDAALLFLKEELKAIPPEQDRTRVAVKVKIYEIGYLIGVRDAEAAVVEFRRRTGELPETPAAVIEVGIELPPDPLEGEWVWDLDPDVELGTVISSRYCEAFTALAREHALGRLNFAACRSDIPQ